MKKKQLLVLTSVLGLSLSLAACGTKDVIKEAQNEESKGTFVSKDSPEEGKSNLEEGKWSVEEVKAKLPSIVKDFTTNPKVLYNKTLDYNFELKDTTKVSFSLNNEGEIINYESSSTGGGFKPKNKDELPKNLTGDLAALIPIDFSGFDNVKILDSQKDSGVYSFSFQKETSSDSHPDVAYSSHIIMLNSDLEIESYAVNYLDKDEVLIGFEFLKIDDLEE